MKPLKLLFLKRALQILFGEGEPINYAIYARFIHRCTVRRLSGPGKQLHAKLILSSTVADNFLASKLIAFYSRTRHLQSARHVFDKIPHKNTFAFNALLIAYSVNSHHMDALSLFTSVLALGKNCSSEFAGVRADSFTLSCVLKSMSEVALGGPRSPGMMHCFVVKNGLDFDVFVGNGLVTYYARCGDVVSARLFFDRMEDKDLVSWNSMLSGYAQGGFYEDCKTLYRQLLGLGGLRPDGVTAVSVLQACAQSTDLVFGMEVHRYVIDNGIKMDLSVCNSIIAVYAKCGSLDYAKALFDEMSDKDEITYSTIISGYMIHGFVDEAMKLFQEMKNPGLSSWNAIISGRVQNKRYDKVLDLVREMQLSCLKPNAVTISSVLPAIPHVSHLKGGKEIHAYTIKTNSDRNIYVLTSTIDMYAKLGYLKGAQVIFDQAKDRSVIVWTSIITAYASHGEANVVLGLFDEMLDSRTMPDDVTFTAVLSACAHAGFVDKAREVFDLLPKYEIEPLANHYSCMVVCLCRAGKLYEAVEFVKKMPIEPTAQVWGALLSGASESGDVELAEFICDRLFVLEPQNPSNYIVMANLYSNAGRWKEAERVREKLNNSAFKKATGNSRVD